MADKIKIIQGEIFRDWRGSIASMNSFDFKGIERYYLITNKDTELIRGWHGHKTEKKWFQCLRGSFTMAFVAPDDWDNPSSGLKPEIYHISEDRSEIIYVPEGYANCLRADSPDSLLLVYSSRRYPECIDDSWRYEPDRWFSWKDIPR